MYITTLIKNKTIISLLNKFSHKFLPAKTLVGQNTKK